MAFEWFNVRSLIGMIGQVTIKAVFLFMGYRRLMRQKHRRSSEHVTKWIIK